MSHGYGFLIESTILPKKQQPIKVHDNSGQILMESTLQKQIQRMKAGKKIEIPQVHKKSKVNPGIQKRIERDKKQQQKITLVEKNSYKCLESKVNVYDKAATKKINIDKLLVNFQDKVDQADKQEVEQFQKAREAFYKGEIKNIESQQKLLHQNIETEKSSTTMMRERLAWQKEMLNELKGDEIEMNNPKVKQSFDNKFSKEERDAFDKILTEEEEQKIKIEAIKRRKQILIEERNRKLRKLNIIDDVDEALAVQRKNEKVQKQ